MKIYWPFSLKSCSYLLLATVQILLASVSNGQNSPVPVENHGLIKYAASPDVSALGKYIMQPPDLSNGSAKKEFNLVDIKENGLSYTLNLFYNFDGLKLKENASSVGLGWGLSEDIIIRIPKHLVDEHAPFKKFEEFESTGLVSEYGPGIVPDQFFCNQDYTINLYDYTANRVYYKLYDAQPDLYIFKFGNYSGRFLFLNNRAIQLDQSDLIIEKDQNDFVIKTPEGIDYRFKESDMVISPSEISLTIPSPTNAPTQIPFPDRYVSAWRVSNIKNLNTKDEIKFSYRLNHSTEGVDFEHGNSLTVWGINDAEASGGAAPTSTHPGTYHFERGRTIKPITYEQSLLDVIESDNLKIKLSYGSRLDGPQNKLVSIVMFNKADSIKDLRKVDFTYGYFGNQDEEETCWLKLKELKISKGGLDAKHTFSYLEENYWNPSLSKVELGIDHWGYANGASNTTLVPYRDLSEFGLSGATGLDWGYREPDFNFARLFALEKVTYPTGGYSQIGYESAHRGIRVKSLVDYDGQTNVTRYYDYGPTSTHTPAYEFYTYETYQCCLRQWNWANRGYYYIYTGNIVALDGDYYSEGNKFYDKVTESFGSIDGTGGKVVHSFIRVLGKVLQNEKTYYKYGQNSYIKKELNYYSGKNHKKASDFWTVPKMNYTSVSSAGCPYFDPQYDFGNPFSRYTTGPLDPIIDCQLGSFHIAVNNVYSAWITLDSTILIDGEVVNKTTYQYAAINPATAEPNHRNLVSVSTYKSDGELQKTDYYYAGDLDPDNPSQYLGAPQMTDNIFHYTIPVIQKRSYVNGALKVVEKNDYQYDANNLFIFKAATSRFVTGTTEPVDLTEFKYDHKARLIEQKNQSSNIKSCIYGYNGLFPIIIGDNITYESLKFKVDQAVSDVEDLLKDVADMETSTQKNEWKNFTLHLNQGLNAEEHINVYTYNGNGGLTSETNPSGRSTYYEYDNFQRLRYVKDQDGNILKRYTYHYKNQ